MVAEDGSWHIQRSGKDLWDHDDQFHYMSKMTEGDIDVSVHVTAFSVVSCVAEIVVLSIYFIFVVISSRFQYIIQCHVSMIL